MKIKKKVKTRYLNKNKSLNPYFEITASFILISFVITIIAIPLMILYIPNIIIPFVAIIPLIGEYKVLDWIASTYFNMKGFDEYRKLDWSNVIDDKTKRKIDHLLFIPTFKDNYRTMYKLLHSIENQVYGAKEISIVIATEKRDDNRYILIDRIEKDFHDVFKSIYFTEHELKIGEMPGKHTNLNYSVKNIVTRNIFDRKRTLVTVIDSDTYIEKEFFSILTYKFFETPENYKKLFSGVLVFFNEYRSYDLLSRLYATLLSSYIIYKSTDKNKAILSSYSLVLNSLIAINYWDDDVISEDKSLGLKMNIKYTEGYSTINVPSYLISNLPHGKTSFESIKVHYETTERWTQGGIYLMSKYIPDVVNYSKTTKKIGFNSIMLDIILAYLINPFYVTLLLVFVYLNTIVSLNVLTPQFNFGFISYINIAGAILVLILFILVDNRVRSNFKDSRMNLMENLQNTAMWVNVFFVLWAYETFAILTSTIKILNKNYVGYAKNKKPKVRSKNKSRFEDIIKELFQGQN